MCEFVANYFYQIYSNITVNNSEQNHLSFPILFIHQLGKIVQFSALVTNLSVNINF